MKISQGMPREPWLVLNNNFKGSSGDWNRIRTDAFDIKDDFEYRTSGRFLLQFATLLFQVQSVGLPDNVEFEIETWRGGASQSLTDFADQVVVMMYSRDVEHLSLRRFDCKRLKLDRMLFVFSSSVSFGCNFSNKASESTHCP